MDTRRHVVAGVDGAAPSLVAIDVAAAEAALRGVPLRLVCPYRPGPAPTHVTVAAPDGPRSAAGARRLVGMAARRVADACPGLAVDATAAPGDPVDVLVEESRRAELVVVGQRGSGGFAGSLADRLCSRAHCPVVVIPSDVVGYWRRPVAVAVKGGDHDASAISLAVDEAVLHGVPLRAVHVWLNIPDMELASVDPFVYDLADARGDADRLIRSALAKAWPADHAGVAVQRLPMYRVDVAAALGEASDDASLLVLSSPRTGPGLLGSVVDRSRCPVAVAHRSAAGHPPPAGRAAPRSPVADR